MTPEPYWTLQQVAEFLRVHEKTVLRLVRSDPSMPVLRIGPKLLRFPRERVIAWLRAREQGRTGRSAHGSAHNGHYAERSPTETPN